MATPQQVEALRQKLGVTGGGFVAGWIGVAFDFFNEVLHVDPLDPKHVRYIRGIDFHRPVRATSLKAGSWLIRFPEIIGGAMRPEVSKPYRFFALPGATPLHLGWNPDEQGFQRFQLQTHSPALLSSASPIKFGDSRSRLGGDAQVVLPPDVDVLLVHERTFDRQKMAELFRAGYLPFGLE